VSGFIDALHKKRLKDKLSPLINYTAYLKLANQSVETLASMMLVHFWRDASNLVFACTQRDRKLNQFVSVVLEGG